MSEKGLKGRFLEPEKPQNHSKSPKEKEKERRKETTRRRKGGEEKKTMALLVEVCIAPEMIPNPEMIPKSTTSNRPNHFGDFPPSLLG